MKAEETGTSVKELQNDTVEEEAAAEAANEEVAVALSPLGFLLSATDKII